MGTRIELHPAWADLLKAAGLETLDALLEAPGEPIRPDRHPGVERLRFPPSSGLPPIVRKRYRYPFPSCLRTFLVPARARREYENLAWLNQRSVRAAEPLAWGVRRVAGCVTDSVLLTREIEGGRNLREVREAVILGRERAPAAAVRREAADRLGRTLARLHRDRIRLHTPFFKNILWVEAEGARGLHFIDLPFARILRHRLAPAAACVRDLACLDKGARGLLSRTERLRFLLAYLDRGRLGPDGKALAQRVDRAVDALENRTGLSSLLPRLRRLFGRH